MSARSFKGKKSLSKHFIIGTLSAESDPYLSEAFFDNGDYSAVESAKDPRCFIIGRTGSGKSAVLAHLHEEHPDKVIRISPENLGMSYVSNLDIVRQLSELGVHLDPFFKTLWKHVFIVELLRHRYTIDSPSRKQGVVAMLLDRFKRDERKLQAIRYVDEFGDNFWCETHERVRQAADTFKRKLDASADASVKAGALGACLGSKSVTSLTHEEKRELAASYQAYVNEAQLPRINEMVTILKNEIIESKQHFTYIVIDDLDTPWVEDDLANSLIRNLFQAVIEMQPMANIKVIVALRTNIFEQLNYGLQTRGGQEEKFRGLSLLFQWQDRDLRQLLDARVQAATRADGFSPPRTAEQLLPPCNREGDPFQFIFARTLMRPRDAILYVNKAIEESAGRDRVTWNALKKAERAYSEERLLALRDEWKDPYLDIDKVFEKFRGAPERMNCGALTKILDEIALLTMEPAFLGTPWLSKTCAPLWSAGHGERSWYQQYGDLVNLLYATSLLGVAPSGTKNARYSHLDIGFSQKITALPDGAHFEVHPAFRAVLDIRARSEESGAIPPSAEAA